MFGCSNDNKVVLSKEEYVKLKNNTNYYKYPKHITMLNDEHGHVWSINLGSDGHEYISNDGYNSYILFHYIDCEKCLKRNKKDTVYIKK